MPDIKLYTSIHAPIEIVFDLSRSIDLHQKSTLITNEKVISGKESGLFGLNEQVTWRARHFSLYQNFTSKITALESPNYFVDEMQKGTFQTFRHEHFFEKEGENTLMKDVLHYSAPLGFIGKIADRLFLEKYLTRFLEIRNETIKKVAETEKWKSYLNENDYQ